MSAKQQLNLYSPPACLTDFGDTLRREWSHAVSTWVNFGIERQIGSGDLNGQPCQYVNLLEYAPKGPVLAQDIVWNAFPGNQFHRFGRSGALVFCDQLLALSQSWEDAGDGGADGQSADLFYRPQDEYCEWRVERNANGRITRVTFTSEPPEYYQALCGDRLLKPDVQFSGDRDCLLALYREHVHPAVQLEDLLCPTDIYLGRTRDEPPDYRVGQYNPYNRWNTTHGLMHLTHPSNTLTAEIILGADASVLWAHPDRPDRVVADPDTLIARGGYGGSNRCSDPTIGASVNQLAALGAAVAIADPVGLYMDHLDMTGWTIGERDEPIDPSWFRTVRGSAGLIERAVFEVPAERGTVSDVRIAGERVRFGGQLAERMTVKLVAQADLGAGFTNATAPAQFSAQAYLTADRPSMVESVADAALLPFDAIPAFDYPDSLVGARMARPGTDGSPPVRRIKPNSRSRER